MLTGSLLMSSDRSKWVSCFFLSPKWLTMVNLKPKILHITVQNQRFLFQKSLLRCWKTSWRIAHLPQLISVYSQLHTFECYNLEPMTPCGCCNLKPMTLFRVLYITKIISFFLFSPKWKSFSNFQVYSCDQDKNVYLLSMVCVYVTGSL